MKRFALFILLLPALAFGQLRVSGGGSGSGVTTIADTTANPDPGRIYFCTADSAYYTWGTGDYWVPISSITAAEMG
ncbi:MAG TPA: hypothetical protein PLF89_14090, partial [bacterium]|nr:hypothetical protein [bacterium]